MICLGSGFEISRETQNNSFDTMTGDDSVGDSDEISALDLEYSQIYVSMMQVAQQTSNSSIPRKHPLLCRALTRTAALISNSSEIQITSTTMTGNAVEETDDELKVLDLELSQIIVSIVRVAQETSNSSISVDHPLFYHTFTKVAALMSNSLKTGNDTTRMKNI